MIDFRDYDINRAVILSRRLYAERLAFATAAGFVAGVILAIAAFVL